jgi:hypothetical protein
MFHRSGFATPVEVAGVPTIGAGAPVVFASPPNVSCPVRLQAPSGTIRPGECFSVRAFTTGGAVRGLFRCVEARSVAGMQDQIVARMLTEPSEAPTRIHERRAVVAKLVAVPTDGRPPLPVHIVDVSPGGLALASTVPFELADLIALQSPSPGASPTLLEVVWRTRSGRRLGGRFCDPVTGALLCSALLGEPVEAAPEAPADAAAAERSPGVGRMHTRARAA